MDFYVFVDKKNRNNSICLNYIQIGKDDDLLEYIILMSVASRLLTINIGS